MVASPLFGTLVSLCSVFNFRTLTVTDFLSFIQSKIDQKVRARIPRWAARAPCWLLERWWAARALKLGRTYGSLVGSDSSLLARRICFGALFD